jgi:hypothetical protein
VEPNGSNVNSVSVGLWMNRSTRFSGAFARLDATRPTAGTTGGKEFRRFAQTFSEAGIYPNRPPG